jgi:hypothetical protein
MPILIFSANIDVTAGAYILPYSEYTQLPDPSFRTDLPCRVICAQPPPPGHILIELVDEILVDILPACLDLLPKHIKVGGSSGELGYLGFEQVPHILNGIQVGRVRWVQK